MKTTPPIMAGGALGLATALAAGRPSNYYYSHPPHYMSMMRSPDWWDSGELTGDWGGVRNIFYDNGVKFSPTTPTTSREIRPGERAQDLLIVTTSHLGSNWTWRRSSAGRAATLPSVG